MLILLCLATFISHKSGFIQVVVLAGSVAEHLPNQVVMFMSEFYLVFTVEWYSFAWTYSICSSFCPWAFEELLCLATVNKAVQVLLWDSDFSYFVSVPGSGILDQMVILCFVVLKTFHVSHSEYNDMSLPVMHRVSIPLYQHQHQWFSAGLE